jgi:hypothetical protein
VDRAALDQLSKDQLIALLLAQEARIAELVRRLGLNSSNSGKLPWSNGLKKPQRTSSLRQPSRKKPFGQTGHPGKMLRRTETPGTVLEHYPPTCAACCEPLTEAMATGYVARQVFDLPEPQPLVVSEHRAHHCRCPTCGTQTRAAFPAWVSAPVQYGKRIVAFTISAALSVAAGAASGHADGRPVRRPTCHGDHRPDQSGLCRALPGFCRGGARSRRRGGGQAHGRVLSQIFLVCGFNPGV